MTMSSSSDPFRPREGDPRDAVTVGGYALGALLRRVRRTADLSQRELAARAEVSSGLIGAIECGRVSPSLTTLQRILGVAGHQLVVVDDDGRFVYPLAVWQDVADGAGRRFPAHLDTILDPKFGEWWADMFGLARPPETFRRNRAWRDWQRAESRWEVRAKQLRHAPRPRRPPKETEWQADD